MPGTGGLRSVEEVEAFCVKWQSELGREPGPAGSMEGPGQVPRVCS